MVYSIKTGAIQIQTADGAWCKGIINWKRIIAKSVGDGAGRMDSASNHDTGGAVTTLI